MKLRILYLKDVNPTWKAINTFPRRYELYYYDESKLRKKLGLLDITITRIPHGKLNEVILTLKNTD